MSTTVCTGDTCCHLFADFWKPCLLFYMPMQLPTQAFPSQYTQQTAAAKQQQLQQLKLSTAASAQALCYLASTL
jgi:hypothetical protein